MLDPGRWRRRLHVSPYFLRPTTIARASGKENTTPDTMMRPRAPGASGTRTDGLPRFVVTPEAVYQVGSLANHVGDDLAPAVALVLMRDRWALSEPDTREWGSVSSTRLVHVGSNDDPRTR